MNELILADLGMFIFLLAATFLVVTITVGFRIRKSKEYRRFLTDMYVSAKIKLLAENDGLDISKEEESFNAWNKKDRVKGSEYNLDDAVEEDLIERIEEPAKKKK